MQEHPPRQYAAKWHPPSTVCFAAEEVQDDADHDVTLTDSEQEDTTLHNKDLPPEQTQELQHLLQEFSDVLCKDPGWTEITEHCIRHLIG